MCGFTLLLKNNGSLDSSLFITASDLCNLGELDFSKTIFYKNEKDIKSMNFIEILYLVAVLDEKYTLHK